MLGRRWQGGLCFYIFDRSQTSLEPQLYMLWHAFTHVGPNPGRWTCAPEICCRGKISVRSRLRLQIDLILCVGVAD